MSDSEAERVSSDDGEEQPIVETVEARPIEADVSTARDASPELKDKEMTAPLTPASGSGEEIDLDYTEDPPRNEENSLDNDEADQDVEEGELTESDEGEIKSDDESPKKATKKSPRSDLEEGELEDGEISDSDDDDSASKLKQHPRISGPTESPLRNRDFKPKFQPSTFPRYRGAPGVSRITNSIPPREETAWERGLREARELMKKATQKKQEPDFEDKRMHLPPSDERDWNHESDDDENGGQRIPSLLTMDLPPPRKVKNTRYKGYEMPLDADTTRIDLILKREELAKQKEEMRNRRSRSSRSNTWESFEEEKGNDMKCNGKLSLLSSCMQSAYNNNRYKNNNYKLQSDHKPQYPYGSDGKGRRPISSSKFYPAADRTMSRRRSRSPPPRPEAISSDSSPERSRSGSRSSNQPPKKLISCGDQVNDSWPRGKRTSVGQRSLHEVSRSRSRSPSSNHSLNRERSPPTGDITSYRIPKRRQQYDSGRFGYSSSEDRRSPWRDVGAHDNGATRGRRMQANRHMARREKSPSPIDLAPTGAVAISDDDSSRSSASGSSSSSSSSSSSRSSSSSSSSKSAVSSKSKSPALPAKYRITNSAGATETASNNVKTDLKVKKSQSSNKKTSPPPNKKRGRVRSPSQSPTRVRGSRSPRTTPCDEKRNRREPNRPLNEQRNRDRASERPKTKEELLEELRRVEERLMRKRRQAAM